MTEAELERLRHLAQAWKAGLVSMDEARAAFGFAAKATIDLGATLEGVAESAATAPVRVYVCEDCGVKELPGLYRGERHRYVRKDEFGTDEPVNCGRWVPIKVTPERGHDADEVLEEMGV